MEVLVLLSKKVELGLEGLSFPKECLLKTMEDVIKLVRLSLLVAEQFDNIVLRLFNRIKDGDARIY